MQLRTRTWLVICVLSLVGAAVFWRLGEQRLSGRLSGSKPADAGQPAAAPAVHPSTSGVPTAASANAPAPGAAAASPAATAPATTSSVSKAGDRASLRLRNTQRSADELAHADNALLLRNALIDTAAGTSLPVPDHLRAAREAGSYIVQAKGPVTDKFRAGISAVGATIVSYLPNNAYLVQASSAQSLSLAQTPGVQAVLPFEPYFKFEPGLLAKAVSQEPVAAGSRLNVTLLPGVRDQGVAQLQQWGASVVSEFRTPFGPAVTIDPADVSLATLARMPEVQGIEMFRPRQLLNDLTRPRLAVSFGTNAPGAYTNTLGLNGTNVWVNVNDTGIDASHPDLEGRVTSDSPSMLVDTEGHGTHVAGIIAGNGAKSSSITNTPSGSAPGADYRGIAPAAKLFGLGVDPVTGPLTTDAQMQEIAATNYYITLKGTNLPISNNSWGRKESTDYDISSASFDGAVRDALPEVSGEQPILYVFAVGNEGQGRDDGQGGEPNTLRSPATGKNVISVGAIEAPRFITNEVVVPDALGNPSTNSIFLDRSDTDYQVAGYSSRGNVDPGVEGIYGRFKPDVVAPGSWVISARSKDWLDPHSSTDAQVQRIPNQVVTPGALNNYTIFVPPGASEFRIRLLPNLATGLPMPGLPIYLKQSGTAGRTDLIGTNNVVRVPSDAVLSSGTWYYAVGNDGPRPVSYDILTIITFTSDVGTTYTELKKLNDQLAPYYRYDTGSSMAAPAVSGLLALYQDWFQRQNLPTSPALLKALLINGARSLGSTYNFNVHDAMNLQGWGLVNLTNALPAGEIGSPTGGVYAVQYTHQTGSNSLVTGQSRSWKVSLTPAARDQVVKFTLVWTDPPGNPSAGVKLVNDLDLEVKNVDTGEVMTGNDIPYRSDYNVVHPEGTAAPHDVINNVENVLLRPPVGSNYVVTVRAKRVNVNAVTRHPDGISQDFALVASLEDTSITNAMSVVQELPDLAVNYPLLVLPTNGLAMLGQRVGANSPKYGTGPGATNQWTFFVFTNSQQFTPADVGITNGSNVAFITFLPPNLSKPRNQQADIDLYVSTDGSITNLNPAAIAAASKSLKPGGTEMVYYTNATLGSVYYIGVKSEDQQASDFGFVALSSNTPFDEDDPYGNRIVHGLPYRLAIPDGSAEQPQSGYVFGVSTKSFQVQRVVVTNTLAYDSTGDIVGNLSHNESYTVLNNHAVNREGAGAYVSLVYDDSNAGDTSYGSILARPTDGPGRLTSFQGTEASGPWILSLVDNAVTQTATNIALTLQLQPKPDDQGYYYSTVLGNSSHTYYIDVPANATNLTVALTGIRPNLPLFVAVRRASPPTPLTYDKAGTFDARGGRLELGIFDVPPLNPGRYYITVFNFTPTAINYGILIDLDLDLSVSANYTYGLGTMVPIRDDARVTSYLTVAEDLEIADVKVGLRADYPRVSDLVFHLVSPQGGRYLLAENRGGTNGTAYGGTVGGQKVFTTFTDNTNLTTTPIKFGSPPFVNNPLPSGVSNRVIMSDGFELAAAADYGAGQLVFPGWRVAQGSASVVASAAGSTNVAEGRQYLRLTPGTASSIATNIVLGPQQLYRVRFAVGRLAGASQQGIRLYIDGRLAVDLKDQDLGTGWYRQSYLFKAGASSTLIEFRSPENGSAFALDQVSVEEADPPLDAYYLPEESFKSILGTRGAGQWGLEVVDSRGGPVAAQLSQFDWRLELVYARPAIEAIRLTNDIPYFSTITGNEVRYFYVEVPSCATLSSNVVAGQLGTLLFYGNRAGLPHASVGSSINGNVGSQTNAPTGTGPDDYGPYLNYEPGGIAQFTLTTNLPSNAPLVPGQRYYLAVRNFQPDLTNNSFGIRVQFDCTDPGLPNVPVLTNGVARPGTIPPGPELQFYQFVVSSNAIRADFELTPINGNVDMFVRYARLDDYPLPSPNLYDYASDNPDPTVVDFVSVERISEPMPLIPGTWYVAVRNADTHPVDYTIKATETYATIVNLTNGVSFTSTIGPKDPLVGVQSSQLQYYAFHVSSNSVRATFETLGANGDVNLFVRRGLPIATPLDYHFAGRNFGTTDELIAVANTDAPIWLSPGWWFLTVDNQDPVNVTYSIKATEFPANIIPLTSGVAVTNTVVAGPTPDYYSFQVNSAALLARFEVFGMSDDVHLLLHRGLPVATYNDFTYISRNAGLADEVIELTPYSFPVGLTGGPWYLSVVNASTNPASYVVRATEQVERIVTLTNGIPQNAKIDAAAKPDYYQFNVSSGATAAEFKLTSAGAGDLDLFVRKGPPLPDAGNAHYAAANPGNGDEFIRVSTNSTPVPVSPGTWYLTVTNKSAITVGYEITATEFGIEVPPPSGQITNTDVQGNRVCLTWVSIPGTNYYVVARTDALSATWTPISPTIKATDYSTTWCLEPIGPWRFFDVLIGESPGVPIVAPVPVLTFEGTDVCVHWASVVGTNYFVEAKKVFSDTEWTVLSPKFTATSTNSVICYPLTWGYRFFRVGVGDRGVPVPVLIPEDQINYTISVDSLCLTFPTHGGLKYLVQAKKSAVDVNWTVVSEALPGTGSPLTFCLGASTEFRYFQVIEGVTVPLDEPASVPVSTLRLSVDGSYQLCVAWDALLGAEYFVEAKQRIADSVWTVISPILKATSPELSYCQSLSSNWRYLQVRRVAGTAVAAPRIDAITLTAKGPQIRWVGPAGAKYQVFYSDGSVTSWQPVGGVLTSASGTFTFVDDGSLIPPPTGIFRLYRIQQVP